MADLLNTIADVTITRTTTYPSKKGFGTICVAAVHAFWPALVRLFTGSDITDQLAALGVPTYHPVYRAAAAAMNQTPKPKTLVVGKRSTNYTQTLKLTPKTAVEGYVYNFTMITPDGVEHPLTYTVPAAATLTSVGTALAALIDPLADITASSATGVITAPVTAGKVVYLADLPPLAELQVEDTTADPGLAADLSAIQAASQRAGISWYGLILDVTSKAQALAAAGWAESRVVLFFNRTSDSVCADALVTTDVLSSLKALTYNRTLTGIFSGKTTADYKDAALAAGILSYPPGSRWAAYNTLTGCSTDNLESGEQAAILAKRGTVYVNQSDVPITWEGKLCSGDFLDNTIAIDDIYQDIQVSIFADKVADPKVGFDAVGIARQKAAIVEVLERKSKGTAATVDSFEVTVPDLSETTTADRAARQLTGAEFVARLKGGIQRVKISGRIGV